MKKLDLGQAIQILANVGVLAGLVFLGLELRQNTQAVRLASAESYLTGGSELDLRIASEPELAAFLIRSDGSEPLSAVDELRLEHWNYAVLRQWETAYYLGSIGALDEGLWAAYRHEIRKILLRTAGMHEFWRANRESFAPDFGKEIDSILAETER